MLLKTIVLRGLFASLVLFAGAFGALSQEMKSDPAKPIVAVVRADWCGYCKKVEPVIAALKKEYGTKLTFAIFDVTDETTTAEAAKLAAELGLADFFNGFKDKTSGVAVVKNGEVTFKTFNNGKREDYVNAFDKALE